MGWELDITARHNQIFTCPECEEVVVARCGEVMVWHFAHKAESDCPRSHVGETREHLEAKTIVGRAMVKAGYSVAVEERLGSLRRPDLTVVSPVTGRWCTVEVQCSPITTTDMWWRWQHDLEAGATDTLWVWAGRVDFEDGRNVFMPEDLRYFWQVTHVSLSVVRQGALYLATSEPLYWVCRECVIWSNGPRCPRCSLLRENRFSDDYKSFTLRPSTGAPVVCKGIGGASVVRFAVVESGDVVEPVAEPL